MNVTPDTLASIRAAEQERGERAWYFLTFMEEKEHLGATVIEACGPADAALTAAEKSIDPGRGRVIMTTVAAQHLPAEEFRGRLLTKAEVESFWPSVREPAVSTKLKVVQEVKPQDGSEPLPVGEYEAAGVKFLSGSGPRSLVTFVVVAGPMKGEARRIGVVEGDFSEKEVE